MALAQITAAEPTLPTLLERVLDQFRAFLGVERALFALCDETGRIRTAVTQGFSWSGDLDALPIRHKRGATGTPPGSSGAQSSQITFFFAPYQPSSLPA